MSDALCDLAVILFVLGGLFSVLCLVSAPNAKVSEREHPYTKWQRAARTLLEDDK